MLARAYLVGGALLLLGYGLASFEGWEFGSTHRGRVPAAGAAAGGRSGGGWWWWWNSGSSGGGGRGGK